MAAVALGRDFEFKVDRPEVCPTGMAEVDAAFRGLPEGCLTEVYGPASSGRTSLMLAVLAQSTGRENVCALVDANDAFDPASAAAAGVRLERLLWVRCGGNAEHALKAADLLVQGGGFGLVVMDLADTPDVSARRISMTSWFRLRRAVEHTPTVLLVVERQPHAKTCASLTLEVRRVGAVWTGVNAGETKSGSWRARADLEVCPTLLRGIRVHVDRRKPLPAVAASFESSW
jgi:recombination protein RecA